MVRILGIESSCDETAAAVIEDGEKMLSSVISSQIEIHKEWGGVVPEIASREHLVKIDDVVERALDEAKVSLDEIDAFAVTRGPGLIGSLLVGVSYAKSLAMAINKPIVGVNHIEGHFYSVEFDNGPIKYPALALIVSGGHTNLFYSPEQQKYKVVSRTRDDAAGEAFDKAAKMLGLGYPGGPVIERIAKEGDPGSIKFPIAKISDGRPDFSFSGLKTAVLRYIENENIRPLEPGEHPTKQVADICASFQHTVVESLIRVFEKQTEELEPETLIVAGGVACNEALRVRAARVGEKFGKKVCFPSRHLSTDNAAMIALAGFHRLSNGAVSDIEFETDVSIRLQNIEVEDDELRKRKVRYKL